MDDVDLAVFAQAAAAAGVLDERAVAVLSRVDPDMQDDGRVEVEHLRHVYRRRLRRFENGSFEWSEISRLVTILEATPASSVRLISALSDSGDKSLLLADESCGQILYWSPMWVIAGPNRWAGA